MKTALAIFMLTILNVGAFQAKVTGYCGAEDKVNGSISCMGTRLHSGQVAADLSIYPIGTKLRIDGEVYAVADCGSAVQGANHFDRYCSSRAEMEKWDTRFCNVEVVGRDPYNSKREHESPFSRRRESICQYSSKRGKIFI